MGIKTLIICPYCALSGKREILAEVDSNMNVIIKRYHVHNTTIQSTHYIISCTCGSAVFKRDNEGTAYITQ